MPNALRKCALFLCLSAASLTLLAPAAYLSHTGCGEAHSFLLLESGLPTQPRARNHYHLQPRSRASHNANTCLLCQAFFQFLSGVTLAQTQNAPKIASVSGDIHACVTSFLLKDQHSPFSSRAPPSSDFFRV